MAEVTFADAVQRSWRIDEQTIAEMDEAISRSLGLAFCEDQEMAVRKAILSAFITLSNSAGRAKD